MNAFSDLRKRQAVVANRQLAEARDIITSIETGERFEVIRFQSDGTHETQKAYLKAMQDIWHLEWLLEVLQDQSSHPRPDDVLTVTPATNWTTASCFENQEPCRLVY